MSNRNSRKIPRILFAIPIVISIAVIINVTLEGLNTETRTVTQPVNLQHTNTSNDGSTSTFLTSKLYSGPFAILHETYGVDDTAFFIGSEIPIDSKGEIAFIRPDGKIHHKLPFDGSESAVNHYFTPVSSSDLKECLDCEFFGTWEISFRPSEGMSYNSIYFKVENNSEKIDN